MIVNDILDALVVNATAKLITLYPESDLARADVVKKGLFQDNPTRKNIYVAFQGGDHEDPKYKDGIVSIEDMDNVNYDVPAREVGGGVMWWRRGVAQIGVYNIIERKNEVEAHEIAYTFLGRVVEAIETTPLPVSADAFGEKAIQIIVSSSSFFQSGGPPASFIFRGKVYWQVLTERG